MNNKKYVYLVNYEYYGEWANDCGACDYKGIYNNSKDVIKEVAGLMLKEVIEDNSRILNVGGFRIDNDTILEGVKHLQNIMTNIIDELYITIYINEEYYNRGHDTGAIVIKIMEIQ